MRQSADRDVNHNRMTQQNDCSGHCGQAVCQLPARATAGIDGIGALNANEHPAQDR